MQKTDIRYKHHIPGNKVGLLILVGLLFFLQPLEAQDRILKNDIKFEQRRFHFGIHLGFNISDFKVTRSEEFILSDEFLAIDPLSGSGFNLGILASLHLHRYIEMRIIPALSFAEKTLLYTKTDNTTEEQVLSSTILEFPLQFKLKSEPIRDFRFYVFVGMKYSFDLASNSKKRNAEDIVKLLKNDIGLDYGLGFELHFPYFILSPEFKVTNGLIDVHSPDPDLNFSRVMKALHTRTFLFSLNFEG